VYVAHPTHSPFSFAVLSQRILSLGDDDEHDAAAAEVGAPVSQPTAASSFSVSEAFTNGLKAVVDACDSMFPSFETPSKQPVTKLSELQKQDGEFRGSDGVVMVFRLHDKQYAVKFIYRNDSGDAETVKELAVMWLLGAQNRDALVPMVSFVSVDVNADVYDKVYPVGVMMPLIQGCTLSAVVKKIQLGNDDYAVRKHLLGRIAEWYRVLHRYGIYHCDGHGGNFMVDTAGDVYMLDFSRARIPAGGSIERSLRHDLRTCFLDLLVDDSLFPRRTFSFDDDYLYMRSSLEKANSFDDVCNILGRPLTAQTVSGQDFSIAQKGGISAISFTHGSVSNSSLNALEDGSMFARISDETSVNARDLLRSYVGQVVENATSSSLLSSSIFVHQKIVAPEDCEDSSDPELLSNDKDLACDDDYL
jgi:hypothetical protein